jgi:Flp pilus assembly protein TadG
MSGIEFAIIAPLLLMIYLGSFELSVGFNVSQKVSQAAGTVADVLSQRTDVTPTVLDGMKNVALSVMAPYEARSYALRVTGIRVIAAGAGTVVWSRDENGKTPYPIGSTVQIPGDMTTINTFLVKSEFSVPYSLALFTPPGLPETASQIITLSKTYYYRQRVGLGIACALCK